MASTKDVIDHHLKTFADGDLDGLMSDYTADSVLFLPEDTLKGPDAIRPAFQAMFEEFAKPGAKFRMLHQAFDGDHSYQRWIGETADNIYDAATDTFVVRNGKILVQSFNAKVTPRGNTKS
jgi:hypothetical protein